MFYGNKSNWHFLIGALIKKHGTTINQNLKVRVVVWFWSGVQFYKNASFFKQYETRSSIWTSWGTGLLNLAVSSFGSVRDKMEPFNFPQCQTKAPNTAAVITTTDARAIWHQRTLGTQCFAAASRLQSLITAKLSSSPRVWWISWFGMKCIHAMGCVQDSFCVSQTLIFNSDTPDLFFFFGLFIFDDCRSLFRIDCSESCFCILNLFLLHCFVILIDSSSPFFLVPLLAPVVVFSWPYLSPDT